jgi:hypothetical protein
MWWQHVKVTNYDNLEADQILRLVINRGLMSDEDEGELDVIAIEKENLSKLYIEDFDNSIMRARGERDHSVRIARLEAFKKALTVSPVNVAFRVTLFATTTSPWSLSGDELEWITYLSNADYTMKKVRKMSKRELVFNHKRIREDIAARAMLRKDVEISQENKVQLKCIDMGYRSLNRLQYLHGGLCILDPVFAYKQDSTDECPVLREPWRRVNFISYLLLRSRGRLRPRLRLHPTLYPSLPPRLPSQPKVQM